MPAVLASLDARVAAGFPRAGAAPARPSWWSGAGRCSRPVLAAARRAVVVWIARRGGVARRRVLASSPTETEARRRWWRARRSAGAAPPAQPRRAGAEGRTARRAPTRPRARVPRLVLLAPARRAVPSPRHPRKVERAVELTSARARDLQRTVDGVVRVTQQAGGYVADSAVAAPDGGGDASLTLRIPTARLDATLARLSARARRRAGPGLDDITGAFVSAADRLKDARAERRALLRALGRATTRRRSRR